MALTKKKKRILNWSLLAFLLVIVIGWTITLFIIGPETLVEKLGDRNSYIFIFLFAIFGGVSTASSSSFYVTVAALAVGGLNPFIIAVISGIGLTLGDIVFYVIGYEGSKVLSNEKIRSWIDRFSKWLSKRPKWVPPLFIFLWTGFTPLPGDILLGGLGLVGYKFKYAIVPLLIGNTVMILWLTLLAKQGVELGIFG